MPNTYPSGPFGQNGEPPVSKRKEHTLNAVIVVLVVLLCVVGAFLLFALLGGGTAQAPAASPSAPVVFVDDDPELPPTSDAGEDYLKETIFIGDSNTVRLAAMGLVDEKQVLAQSSIGIGWVTGAKLVELPGSSKSLTIDEAIAELRPKRVLIMMGTNDIGGISEAAFAKNYQNVLEAIRRASPETQIVVAGIPPICEQNGYPNLSKEAIQSYNNALRELCVEMGVPYLDTHDALAGVNDYCLPGYTEEDGIHLTEPALTTLLEYYRTHAWQV